MSLRIKIAILDPLGRHAGFHYYTEGLASGLAEAGADVTLYGFETPKDVGGTFRAINAFGGLYGSAPAWRRGLRFVNDLLSSLLNARRHGVKLFHIHCFHYDVREVIAATLIRLFGFRLVVTLHDIDSFGKSHGRRGRGTIMGLADGVVVHNDFSLETIRRFDELAVGKLLEVIPHGHYIGDYPDPPSRADARKALKLPADGLIALFFGNPRQEKGLDLLLDAARLIDDQRILVLSAGKVRDEQLDGLRELESGPLAGKFRLDAGHVSDADAERYYRASDVVVIPYRRIYESGVAIMAMSFARCVVYSDLPPLVASVGEAGMVFKSANSAALAERLHQALAAPTELDRFGEEGQLRVEATRGWPLIGRLTAMAYARVLRTEPELE